MTSKILLDHDCEGYVVFLVTGLQETGWQHLLTVEFLRLHDLGLPDDASDQEIWRRCQEGRLLLITHNRNQDDETSLQATIQRENTAHIGFEMECPITSRRNLAVMVFKL